MMEGFFLPDFVFHRSSFSIEASDKKPDSTQKDPP